MTGKHLITHPFGLISKALLLQMFSRREEVENIEHFREDPIG